MRWRDWRPWTRGRRGAADGKRGEGRPLQMDGPDLLMSRMLHGYGPLVGFALLFLLMVGFVPTIDEGRSARAVGGSGGTQPGGTSGYVDPTSEEFDGIPGVRNDPTAPGAPSTVSTSPGPAPDDGASTVPVAVPNRGEGSCAGSDAQLPGDPYSPPCVEFEGGNGGATSRGVTAENVRLAVRILDEKGFQQTLASLAGADIVDDPSDIRRTVSAVAEFFNRHYQFYGRQIEIAFHDGSGSCSDELLGRGQAEAQADAKRVASELEAFAELNGCSVPYVDALVQQRVIGFGSPYVSREWHMRRAPYAWSISTDCSIVAEAAAELANKMLVNRPAKWAGGDLQGQTRKLAGISPENSWYQECHTASIRMIEEAGNDAGEEIHYKLDINTMSNQAATVVAKLKSVDATTVLYGGDPIFPVFLTAKAAEQGYQPEWVPVGTAATDIDVVGQLMDQDGWSRAFAISSLGSPVPIRAGLGYSAYKSVRDDEPAFAVELIYGQMLIFALGLHMAGPNLTPDTFQQGLFAYPGGSGRFGTWGFDERSYTPTRDYRVLWWDPDAISIENSKRGAYQEAFDGRRFPIGQFPTIPTDQQPPLFDR